MYENNIINLNELNEEKKTEAVKVFTKGFKNTLTFADEDEALKLFLLSFDFKMMYVYIKDDEVLGVLGVSTLKNRVYDFKEDVCRQLFKRKGKFIYKQLRMSTDNIPIKNEEQIYIELLTTCENHRNKGIAGKLLDFACDMKGYEECHLEVLSKNVNAHRLYKKLGFEEYKKSFNFFTFIQGLGSPIFMKKTK